MLYGKYFVVWSPCSWKMSQKHFVWTKWTSHRLMSCRYLSLVCLDVEHFVHQTSWFLRFISFNDFCMISSCSSSLVSTGYAGKYSSIFICIAFVSASSYFLNVSKLMCHWIFCDRPARNHWINNCPSITYSSWLRRYFHRLSYSHIDFASFWDVVSIFLATRCFASSVLKKDKNCALISSLDAWGVLLI